MALNMRTHIGITVIICTWNRANSLLGTLRSLNEQMDFENLALEVIVVDNNSSDNTKEVVDEALKDWKLGELRYAFEPRQGKQFALNHGIQISKYGILAFTDDDIIFPGNWIHAISEVFKDEALDLAGGKTIIEWSSAGQPSWYSPTMQAILGGVDLGDKKLSPPPNGYAPAGGNLVARRSLFNRVGGFSEIHFRHMDYEFGLRCAQLQANIAYEPSLLIFAPVANECLTKRYFRRWSFKAGIPSNSEVDGASLPPFWLVPRWVYRQLVEDFVYVISHAFFSDEAVCFSRELRIWRALGLITSRWYEKYRPQDYPQWVEKYSQKKKDVY